MEKEWLTKLALLSTHFPMPITAEILNSMTKNEKEIATINHMMKLPHDPNDPLMLCKT